MKTYGWRQGEYRDDAPGATSKYAKLRGSKRRVLRRLLHKYGRRLGKALGRKQLEGEE